MPVHWWNSLNKITSRQHKNPKESGSNLYPNPSQRKRRKNMRMIKNMIVTIMYYHSHESASIVSRAWLALTVACFLPLTKKGFHIWHFEDIPHQLKKGFACQ